MGTELAVVQQSNALAAYEPRNFTEAMQLADWFARSGLTGKAQSKEAVFLIMATGAELGLPATTALRSISVIEGKPALFADLKVALCTRSPLCEYFELVETTDQGATYKTKKRGQSEKVHTYTMKDAERQGLLRKSQSGNPTQWEKIPKTMLRHRCSSELAQMVYPELVLGLPTIEEAKEAAEQPFASPGPAPVVLGSDIGQAPAPTSPAQAATPPAAPAQQPSAPPAAPALPLAQWEEAFATGDAKRVQETADAIAAAKLPKSSPDRARLGALHAAAVKRLKQEQVNKDFDAAAGKSEREPGADDA